MTAKAPRISGPALVETLETLLEEAPGADAFYLARSAERPPEVELDALFERTLKRFTGAVEEIRSAWGEATWQGSIDDADFPSWSEALVLAFWRRPGGNLAFVALRHDDDALPMLVEIGAITSEEAETLALRGT